MNSTVTKIGAIVLTMATSAPAMAASACPTAAEAGAERVRILQTELMVAALKCRARDDLALFQKYNSFVHKYTPQLVQQGKTLTGYFERVYGAGYRQKMDKYITSLANSVSISSDKSADFCEATSARADAVLSGTPNVNLASMSVRNPSFVTLATCGPNRTASAKESTPVASAE